MGPRFWKHPGLPEADGLLSRASRGSGFAQQKKKRRRGWSQNLGFKQMLRRYAIHLDPSNGSAPIQKILKNRNVNCKVR